jgi:tetratricopeptide (TPR) repeat protein
MNKVFLPAAISLAIGLASQSTARTLTTSTESPAASSHNKLFKGKVSLNITKGEKLMAENKYEDAANVFRAELARNSKSVDATAGLGTALAMQFKLDAANEQFEKTLALDPTNALAHVGKALVAVNRLQSSNQTVIKNRESILSAAESDARMAISTDSTLPQTHYALGTILKEQGRLPDARTEFQSAVEADPEYSSAYTGLGHTALAENNTADAISNFRRAIELSSANSSAHYGLGEALLRQGSLDEAIKELNTSLYQFRNSAPVHLALGKAYEGQGNVDAALKEYERAALIKPEMKEAYSHMAALHIALGSQFQTSGNLVSALKEYRQAQLIEPQNAEPYMHMADMRETRGDTELAVAELRSGVELNPTDARLHQRIGESLLKLDKFDDAVKEFRTVLQSQPNNTACVDGLTRALYLKSQKQSQGSFIYSNDYETAEQTLQQAIRLRPQDLQLHLALAKLHAMSGKPVDLTKVGTPRTDAERISYAEALLAQNKFADAQQQMRDVVAHTNDPQQVAAVADLALMIKDLDSAEAAYNKAQSLGLNDRAARGLAAVAHSREDSNRGYRLANDLLRKKQLASAVDNFRQASFNNPRLADARFGLAEAERRLSPDSPPALRDSSVQYRAYVALSPNLPEKMRTKLAKRADQLDAKATKIEQKQKVATSGATK